MQPNPPNKNPGGGQAISGAGSNIIYPKFFRYVNRNHRLNEGLDYLALWNETMERHVQFLINLKLLRNGGTHAR
jgi:hypothetical protein